MEAIINETSFDDRKIKTQRLDTYITFNEETLHD
jgi:hypothetical protein